MSSMNVQAILDITSHFHEVMREAFARVPRDGSPRSEHLAEYFGTSESEIARTVHDFSRQFPAARDAWIPYVDLTSIEEDIRRLNDTSHDNICELVTEAIQIESRIDDLYTQVSQWTRSESMRDLLDRIRAYQRTKKLSEAWTALSAEMDC